ncbi:nuclear transport factor 2 family protein [Thalassotalea ganghwensis]
MDSYQEINGVLQRYFDGLYHADADLLASVFHINAHYSCAVDKELIHLSMEEYFANVRQRQSPASLKLPRNDRVLAIDIVGQHTAMAKVQCVLAPRVC